MHSMIFSTNVWLFFVNFVFSFYASFVTQIILHIWVSCTYFHPKRDRMEGMTVLLPRLTGPPMDHYLMDIDKYTWGVLDVQISK